MRKIPNTFGIDVTAARFLEYGSEDELRELIAAGQVVSIRQVIPCALRKEK